MAASLTIAGNNTDTLTVLLDECRRMEIPVLPPDVNESTLNFTPTDGGGSLRPSSGQKCRRGRGAEHGRYADCRWLFYYSV